MLKRVTILLTLLVIGTTLAAHAGTLSYDQALQKAAKSDKPVLLKIGTSWCSSCKAFDKAVETDADFRSGIAGDAILVQLDAEKGEGVSIAERYHVKNYPTFVLTNADGDALDRWLGFKKAEHFTKTLAKAVVDPVTVSDRWTRFAKSPNAKDAAKLAAFRMGEGYYGDAAALYQRAMDMNKVADYTWARFTAVSKGAKKGFFTNAAVIDAADALFARADESSSSMFGVLWTMRNMARHEANNDLFVPYLKAAIETTEESEDEEVAKYRKFYKADYVLFVEGDAEKAIEVKRAGMDEGWDKNANELNNFAWWCFENSINLDEAYELAGRGVDLAKAGNEKANILDTMAEICNLKGDCDEAVTLIHLAIAEDPENEYFQGQAERFEAALLTQEQG